MFKRLVHSLMFLIALHLLAGCMSPKYSVAKNESDVRQGISVDSGYPGCPDCNKVMTFTSSALTSYGWSYNASPNDKGQLTGRVHVGVTNNQPNNSNVYFMEVEQTNSGIFSSWATVSLVDDAGNKMLLNKVGMNNELGLAVYQMKGYGKNKQCQGNIGFSCWWTDYFMLTPEVVNHAIDSGHPLTIFIGQDRAVAATDGFNRKIEAVPVGATVTVSSEFIKIFRAELASRGVQLPSSVERH